MGSAISANLVRAGFETFGYDVLPARRKVLERAGGIATQSAAQVVAHTSIALTSLPSVAALDRVARELARNGRRGGIVLETSTLPIEDKLRARAVLGAAASRSSIARYRVPGRKRRPAICRSTQAGRARRTTPQSRCSRVSLARIISSARSATAAR
jgi:hypothetical protein